MGLESKTPRHPFNVNRDLLKPLVYSLDNPSDEVGYRSIPSVEK